MRKKLIWVVAGALLVALAPSTAFAALVAEWKMDEPEGATTMNDSASFGGANNGRINSVMTGVPPLVSGRAYQFDGATSYVEVDDDASLDPGSANITVQATVKIEDGEILDDSYDIIRKGITSTPGGDWKMEVKRGADTRVGKLLCLFKGSGGTVRKQAKPDVVDGNAHTLGCVKTADKVQAVVDGRAFTSLGNAGSIANAAPVTLGSKVAGDDVLQGVLDHVTINIG